MLYSYVITRDYGFAPNPFGRYCTLATCKPKIRLAAKVGDVVIGTGSASKKYDIGNRLIYAMQIDEIMSFAEYWNDIRFQYKKPVMNGSKKQKYGDNIYYFNEELNKLVQINSHHSLKDGSTNEKNYKRDTSGKYVLISNHFWYFGKEAPRIPKEFVYYLIKEGVGHKKEVDMKRVTNFMDWLSKSFDMGYSGEPQLFSSEFERYNGN